MNKDDVTIPEPCHADWSEMTGDARRRFCASCSKHVHNLSEMTEPQARAVLQKPDVCVRYTADRRGQIRFQPSRRALLRRGALLGGALSISLPAAAAMMVEGSGSDASCERPSLLRRLWDRLTQPEPEPLMGGLVAVEPPEPVPEPVPEEVDTVEQGEVVTPIRMGRVAPATDE